MSEPDDDRTVSPLAVLLPWLAHAALAGALLYRLCVSGPQYARTFAGFNLKLPVLTEFVLSLSASLLHRVALAGGVMPLLAALDAAALYALGGWSRVPGRLWFWGVAVAVAAAWGLVEAAYLIPTWKLYEGLSK